MKDDLRESIIAAHDVGEMVELWENGGSAWTSGYVVGYGPDWFAIYVIDGRVYYNGYTCFRFDDFQHCVSPHRKSAFYKAVLAKRDPTALRRRFSVNLSNTESILETASYAFPIIGLGMPDEGTDIMFIGEFDYIEDGECCLKTVDTDGSWDEEALFVRLSAITEITFGSRYLEALWIVGRNEPRPQEF